MKKILYGKGVSSTLLSLTFLNKLISWMALFFNEMKIKQHYEIPFNAFCISKDNHDLILETYCISFDAFCMTQDQNKLYR